MRKLLLIVLAIMLAACSAESTLKTLAEEFPQHKTELNELKDLMLALSDSAKDFIFLSSRVTEGKDDLIDFFEKEGRIPVSKVMNTAFKAHGDQLLRVQAIVRTAGIDYVSVDKERKAVWVTFKGGGCLVLTEATSMPVEAT